MAKRMRQDISTSSSAIPGRLDEGRRGRFGSSYFDSDALKLPGKKGVCYQLNQDTETRVSQLKYLNPSWNYSWSSKAVDQQPTDIEFVPMIWGGSSQSKVQEVIETNILPAYQAGTVKRLLGFNEPDGATQANMAVSAAVSLWQDLEATGMPLAGPAVTTHGVGTWMKDWNDSALENNLRVDYVAVHWYGDPSPSGFKAYMEQMYALNGGQTPLLITEFAPADWQAPFTGTNRFSREQVLDFMKDVLPWLEHPDQAHWIYGYAWFPFDSTFGPGSCSALFEDDGSPTKLGEFYRTVRPDNPYGDQSISY